MMRGDQRIRGLVAIMLGGTYSVRVVSVGNGLIDVFGHSTDPFGLLVIAGIVLALPETIDMVPGLPSLNVEQKLAEPPDPKHVKQCDAESSDED